MKSVDLELLNEVVEKSGLKQAELASLFEITRQTLHSWRSGKPAANDFIVQRAEKMCRALMTAISAETLPLTYDIAPGARMGLIKKAMLGKQ